MTTIESRSRAVRDQSGGDREVCDSGVTWCGDFVDARTNVGTNVGTVKSGRQVASSEHPSEHEDTQ